MTESSEIESWFFFMATGKYTIMGCNVSLFLLIVAKWEKKKDIKTPA